MAMKGKAKHLARLKRLADIQEFAGRVVFEASDMIRAEAQNSITRGSVSGKRHQPSPPGTPPHNNTGVLKGNIENERTGPITAEVRSLAPYSAVHEFGSSTHPARPFMRAARDKMVPAIDQMIAKRFKKFIRESGR